LTDKAEIEKLSRYLIEDNNEDWTNLNALSH